MRKFVTVLAMAALLSGCTSGGGMSSGNQPGSYCYEHTAVCVIGGVVVVGLAAGIIASNHHHDHVVIISDQRLKRDIKPLMVTDDGIKIYSYRYLGDDRLFSGAIAQDLLDDPKFSDAVTQDENGFYNVDYGKLGVPVVNEAAMKEAGRKAESIALSQMNPQ